MYIRRPLPSLGLGGAAPGITAGVQHVCAPWESQSSHSALHKTFEKATRAIKTHPKASYVALVYSLEKATQAFQLQQPWPEHAAKTCLSGPDSATRPAKLVPWGFRHGVSATAQKRQMLKIPRCRKGHSNRKGFKCLNPSLQHVNCSNHGPRTLPRHAAAFSFSIAKGHSSHKKAPKSHIYCFETATWHFLLPLKRPLKPYRLHMLKTFAAACQCYAWKGHSSHKSFKCLKTLAAGAATMAQEAAKTCCSLPLFNCKKPLKP